MTVLHLTFEGRTPESEMVVTNIIPSSADENNFVLTPTRVSKVTGDQPVPIDQRSFDVSVSPAPNTEAVLAEITLYTNSPVSATTNTGTTVEVGIKFV